MNKFITSRVSRQEKLLSQNIYSFLPAGGYCQSNALELVKNVRELTQAECKVFNLIVYMNGKLGQCYMSQAYMGLITNGRCRQTINRIIKRLVERGLIYKRDHPFRTCLYEVSALVFGSLRSTLSKYLPSLKQCLLYSLISMPLVAATDHDSKNNATLLYEYYINNIFSSHEYSRKKKIGDRQTKLTSYLDHPLFNDPEFTNPSPDRRSCMNEAVDTVDPFSKTISSMAQEFKLTQAGKVMLSAYPDEICLYAAQQLRKQQTTINDPGKWLRVVAAKACQEFKKKPDWGVYNQLAILLNVDNSAPLSISEYKPSFPFKPSYKNTQDTKGKTVRSSTKAGDYGMYRPWKPEERNEIDVIHEYVKFQAYMQTEQCKLNEEKLGVKIKNPFLQRVINLNLPQEQLQELGVSCPKMPTCDTTSPATPLLYNDHDSVNTVSGLLKHIFEPSGKPPYPSNTQDLPF